MEKVLEVVILAAGQGTRMKSALAKVLHPIGGTPMLSHVIATAKQLSPQRIHVVYGHGGDTIQSQFGDDDLNWCLQHEQLGTGHAVLQAIDHVSSAAIVLVLYGDVPLIREQTLHGVLQALPGHVLSLLTANLDKPEGYGRILRDEQGKVRGIVEEQDASEVEKRISQVNTGFLAAGADDLKRWLSKTNQNNAQGEYYLTDCTRLAIQEGGSVTVVDCNDVEEIMGINDKQQLAVCERAYQRRQALQLMEQGVTLRDPARLDVRGKVIVGRDINIDINVILEGQIQLGDDVKVGANCIIKDSSIGAGTEIKPNSVIEQADIGNRCQIGPFTRIRPQTNLADEVHLGNFVEVKKSFIDATSKVNHLSYIGDSEIGKRVNVGAGTITCNYDGANKHKTKIGDDVFIGSDTQLIAPVELGDGTTIGAGSTITKDTPTNQLTLSRAPQVSIKGWQRPRKAKAEGKN